MQVIFPYLSPVFLALPFSCLAIKEGTEKLHFLHDHTVGFFPLTTLKKAKKSSATPQQRLGFLLWCLFQGCKNQRLWMSWWFAVMTPCAPASMGRWWGYNLHSKVSQVNCNDGSTQQHLPSAYLTQISQFIVWVCSEQLWLLQSMSC